MAENEKVTAATENKSDRRRREEAATASKRKRQTTIIALVLAVCVVLGVALSLIQGNLIYRSIKALKVGDTEYSVAEYNWLYTNSYFEIYENLQNQYGSYASYILDTTKPLKDQQYTEGQTWDDYIREYTEKSFINITSLCDEAEKNGWVLEDVYHTAIDNEWESVKSAAAEYQISPDSYLVSTYGKGVNEKIFREMYEKYYYAYTYGLSIQQGFEISDSEIDARYNEDTKAYDQVSYKYLFISQDAEEEDGDAQEAEPESLTSNDELISSNTDAAEPPMSAKEKAEALRDAEDMEAYAKEKLDAEVKTIRNYKYDGMNSAYRDWMFDSSRKAGDREVFEAESGYYVIEYLEKADLHYNTVSMRHILVAPEDSSSEDSWDEAKATLQTYLDTWEEMGGGEEYFSYFAMGYSADTGSQSTGGLYRDIYHGQMDPAIDEWIFDSARKEGDVEIIRSAYGYHAVYFVGEGDEYYHSVVDSDIRNEMFSDYCDNLEAGYTATELDGIKYTAQNH